MDVHRSPSEELLDLLLEQGALDRATGEVLRLRLRDSWVPIGKILRQKGFLTMNQLMELLQAQSSNPRMRIGELALQRGYCTLEQVEAALKIQHDLSPHVLDLLAEEPDVSHSAVMRVITQYVRGLEARLGFAPVEHL